MPGPASAELTTGKSIRQLQLHTVSSFHLFPELRGTLATQQLDGVGKGKGGHFICPSSVSHEIVPAIPTERQKGGFHEP